MLHSPSFPSSFFFNDTATTEIYTLSLHDALPISPSAPSHRPQLFHQGARRGGHRHFDRGKHWLARSEEHTSELQSHLNLVCRLLLETKIELRTKPAPSKHAATPPIFPPLSLHSAP